MLRKHESGACKRKLKKEREEMVAKLPKMTNFFSSNQTNMQFPQTVNNNINNERKDENNNTENEVACQGPSNEIQEVESVESTMHNNELDSDTILREDPALWPLQLKENERMKYLNKGYAFFQNKDSNFESSKRIDESETENTLILLHVLKWIVETDIIDVFPNVYIAYRLFLTIPITNCEAEKSFLKELRTCTDQQWSIVV
ncbi:uncharacterized protein LOC136092047 [Hydra vulgaris]|uniref:Uncharacterized protein LOC136092047 n=1 Tax=Hydra vulgaris TaxID=6087 RepID=A0ABM4DMQ3_HYDVU